MRFICNECGKSYSPDGLQYKCDCGGLFRLAKEAGEAVELSVSLGESETPLLQRVINGIPMYLKLEFLMPTGSFKDRGAAVLVSHLKNMGIKEVVEDSSGNAGAAIAAYCAAAGIKCRIYLPASTSPGKIRQIAAYGADVIKTPGSRDETARAVTAAAKTTYYASHIYNPLFFEGTATFATETLTALGRPDYVFIPIGNGTLLLGAYQGFAAAGPLPRLIGVQSANCAPVYHAYHGSTRGEYLPTLAEGIAIDQPPRLVEMVNALKKSRGDCVTVTETEISAAATILAGMGLYVEPTAAVAVAGALRYFTENPSASGKTIIPLTGSGLKK